MHQIIDQACDALAGEIQRSLDFYLATSGEQEISRIYVSGGSAYLAPLAQAIEQRARVPVQLFDPMVNLAVDPKSVNEPSSARGPRSSSSRSGSRLRCDRERRSVIRVNLLPQKREARAARSPRRSRRRSWLLARARRRCVVEVVVLLVRPEDEAGRARRHLSRRTAEIQGSIDDIKKQIANHAEIKAQLKELRDREDAIQKLQAARTGPTVDAARARALLTAGRGPDDRPRQARAAEARQPGRVYNPNWDPRRLWLTSLLRSPTATVKLGGLARDGEDVSELERRLKAQRLFLRT